MCVVEHFVRVFLIGAVCYGAAFASMRADGPSALSELAIVGIEQNSPAAPDNFALARLDPQVEVDKQKADAMSMPFGNAAIEAPREDIALKWRDLQAHINADINAVASCETQKAVCSQAMHRFSSIVELGKKKSGRIQIGWINRAVNLSIRPMSDWAQYGFADVWASPLQTLGSGAGDCEDYAAVKYAILRVLGFAPDDLRFVIVQDSRLQTEHAVIAVRYDNEWTILDNRTMTIFHPQQAGNYRPLYVLDEQDNRAFKTATLDPLTIR